MSPDPQQVEHRDLSGRLIEVGDTLVYAALWDRSAHLKYGIVLALNTRDENGTALPTARVHSIDRDWGGNWYRKRPGTIQFLDRALVVTRELIPAAALVLLDKLREMIRIDGEG